MVLLGARVLTVEEGTHKYEIGKARKNPAGVDGRHQCDPITSNMCMYI